MSARLLVPFPRGPLGPALALACAIAFAACFSSKPPEVPEGLATFQLTVEKVYTSGAGKPSPALSSACLKAYNGAANVPAAVRGSRECPFAVPRGDLYFDIKVQALAGNGQPLTDFAGPVAFKVVPGELTGDYAQRWVQARAGGALATIRAARLFGEVRVWAMDAPPELIYADGGLGGTIRNLPVEPAHRTFASAASAPIYFEEPTLAAIQRPDDYDNRSSPLVGQFVTVGKGSEATQAIQSCPDDAERDGKPQTLVVTGLDPGGFFVTDVTACRVKEELSDPQGGTITRSPEPDGFLPGTYGSIYVYNYSFPEGLYPGDRLNSLAGSIQEFTSTTQLTFPSWSIAESVRLLPETEWNKWLGQVKPADISARTCGLDDAFVPFLTDLTCGQNRRSLKLESLESGLVKLRGVKLPEVFARCDQNGDQSVPFFCETRFTAGGCPTACEGATPYCNIVTQKCQATDWGWGDCGASATAPEAQVLRDERRCYVECIAGQGPYAGKVCTERSNFIGFGQLAVELPAPGPAAAGLDASLPKRTVEVAIAASSVRPTQSFSEGREIRLFCDAPVRVKFGDAAVLATASSQQLGAKTVLEHTFGPGETHLAFLSDGDLPAGAKCYLSENPHLRIQVVLRDAIPDLNVECSVDDANAEAAESCRNLRAATYDIVGHLRHVQPGRPRWLVMPRDVDDVCCHPGPGRACPKPLKPCSQP